MKKIPSSKSSRQKYKESTRKHFPWSPSPQEQPISESGSLENEREKAYRLFPTTASTRATGRAIRLMAKAK